MQTPLGVKRRQHPLAEPPWFGSFPLWKLWHGFNNTPKLSEEEDEKNRVSQRSYGAYLRSCCGRCSMWIKKRCTLQPVWTEERFLSKLQQPPRLLLHQSWAECKSQACWREAQSRWQPLAVEEKIVLVCPAGLPRDWEELGRSLHSSDNDFLGGFQQLVHLINVLQLVDRLKQKACIFSRIVLRFRFM